MAIFTVRISDELRKQMEKYKHINWSEVVRQAILKTLEKEEERNLAKAVLLNEKNVIVPEEGYSSVEIIRKWRETIRWK